MAEDLRYLDTTDGEMGWSVPSVGVTIPGSESEFQAMSWEQLAQMSAACASAGATDYQKLLGYTKPVAVTGVGTVTTRLIGLCHDTYVGGGTAGFTFQLQDGLSTSKPVEMTMGHRAWSNSDMRKTNLPALLSALPSDLRSVIRKVTKKSGFSTDGTWVEDTDDDLFLLSLVESIGTTKTAYTDNPITSDTYMYYEGSQYEYYSQFDSSLDEANSHHSIIGETGNVQSWWLRTQSWGNKDTQYIMSSKGGFQSSRVTYSYLPAAGFCL